MILSDASRNGGLPQNTSRSTLSRQSLINREIQLDRQCALRWIERKSGA